MKFHRILAVVLLSQCLTTCEEQHSSEVTVAVAASAYPVILEIAKKYEENQDVRITLIKASSGQITNQVLQGAPYDIFISADTLYPWKIFQTGSSTVKPKLYAQGRLLLWSATAGPGFKEVLSKSKMIAIPNPQLAPYGRAVTETLESLQLLEALKNQLITGESVSQVNQYINSRSVDAAFTSASSLHLKGYPDTGQSQLVPDSLHEPILQAAILLDVNSKSATKFYTFLFSSEAAPIFSKYDYLTTF